MKPKIYKSLEEARCVLLKQVKKFVASKQKYDKEKLKIVRLEVVLEKAHPLEWLTLQDCPRKIFWGNRSQKEQYAGIGTALEVKDGKDGYEKILLTVTEYLRKSPKTVRFFGGMRFDSKAVTSPEWQDWGTAHFTLPMIELSLVDQTPTLACHIIIGKDTQAKLEILQTMLESVRVEDISIPDSPLIRLERHDLPEYRQWCDLVEQGLKNISSGKLNKVV